MDKKTEIAEILTRISIEKKIEGRLNQAKIQKVATELLLIDAPSKPKVKETIHTGDFSIKEAIDFTDTNFWIDQIVDIIKR